MRRQLTDIRRHADSRRLRVMLVVGRSPGSVQGMYVAGGHTFLNEIIEAAGGSNIFADTTDYPQPNLEDVIRRNPQVIIEIRTGVTYTPEEKKKIVSEWSELGNVDAVKNRRIYFWTDDYLTIPGPRVVSIVERMHGALVE